jgi:predicted 3-demethylubiquinone-9 3-methyltransferase (glyoxalase superfamily)
MDPIVPNLWFDDNAEEAASFYVSLFEDSKVTSVIPYGPDTPGKEGTTMVVQFVLEMNEMLLDPDQEKVNRVTQAFLAVDGEPFDIAELRAAFEGTA